MKNLPHIYKLINEKSQDASEFSRQLISTIKLLDDLITRPEDFTVSNKYDGAPAFVIGYDLSGSFFVSSKSFFNKKPILHHSLDGILSYKMPDAKRVKLIRIWNHFHQDASIYLGDENKSFDLKPGDVIGGEYLWDIHSGSTPNIIKYDFSDKESTQLGVIFHSFYQINKINKKIEKRPFPSIRVPGFFAPYAKIFSTNEIPLQFIYDEFSELITAIYEAKEKLDMKGRENPYYYSQAVLSDFHEDLMDVFSDSKHLEFLFPGKVNFKDELSMPPVELQEGFILTDNRSMESWKIVDKRFTALNQSSDVVRGWDL